VGVRAKQEDTEWMVMCSLKMFLGLLVVGIVAGGLTNSEIVGVGSMIVVGVLYIVLWHE
jgi:hypothetical protein